MAEMELSWCLIKWIFQLQLSILLFSWNVVKDNAACISNKTHDLTMVERYVLIWVRFKERKTWKDYIFGV